MISVASAGTSPLTIAVLFGGHWFPREWWMPANGALHGIAVDRLMKWNLLALVACFLIAHLWIVLALFRRRRRREAEIWNVQLLPLAGLCVLYIVMAVTAQRLWATDRFEGPSLEAL